MIVAGFGFRTSATAASLRDALAQHGACAIAALAVPDDKVEAFAAFAGEIGLPVIPVSADALTSIETDTRSAASCAARGTGSVAEAAALAAAGPGARLLGARRISADRLATCAIAEGSVP